MKDTLSAQTFNDTAAVAADPAAGSEAAKQETAHDVANRVAYRCFAL